MIACAKTVLHMRKLLILLSLVFVFHLSCTAKITEGQTFGKGRGWLGISIQDLTPSLRKALNLETEKGVLVNEVSGDSPAEEAGIEEGDIVIEYDGKQIEDTDQLIKNVRRTKPGKEVEITVMRSGGKKKLNVRIDKMPRNSYRYGFDFVRHRKPSVYFYGCCSNEILGMQLQDLNKQLGKFFDIPGADGVLVTYVEKDSRASDAGFKAGDVIVSAADKDVDEIEDLADILEGFDEGDKVNVGVIRKGDKKNLSVDIDESIADNLLGYGYGTEFKVFPKRFRPLEPKLHLYDDQELDDLRGELEKLREELRELKERI